MTEMKMLRHIYNIDWEDHATNDNIMEEAKIEVVTCNRYEEETSSMVWTCMQKR